MVLKSELVGLHENVQHFDPRYVGSQEIHKTKKAPTLRETLYKYITGSLSDKVKVLLNLNYLSLTHTSLDSDIYLQFVTAESVVLTAIFATTSSKYILKLK